MRKNGWKIEVPLNTYLAIIINLSKSSGAKEFCVESDISTDEGIHFRSSSSGKTRPKKDIIFRAWTSMCLKGNKLLTGFILNPNSALIRCFWIRDRNLGLIFSTNPTNNNGQSFWGESQQRSVFTLFLHGQRSGLFSEDHILKSNRRHRPLQGSLQVSPPHTLESQNTFLWSGSLEGSQLAWTSRVRGDACFGGRLGQTQHRRRRYQCRQWLPRAPSCHSRVVKHFPCYNIFWFMINRVQRQITSARIEAGISLLL